MSNLKLLNKVVIFYSWVNVGIYMYICMVPMGFLGIKLVIALFMGQFVCIMLAFGGYVVINSARNACIFYEELYPMITNTHKSLATLILDVSDVMLK